MVDTQHKVAYRRLTDKDGQPIDDVNPLPVNSTAVIDEDNSFDDRSFAADEEFIGEWTETLDYSIVTFLVDADESSATNGAKVEYSDNGTDIERVLDATILGTAVGGSSLSFALTPHARFFRVRYLNGPDPATVNLQTILRPQSMGASTAPLASEIGAFDSAQLTRAVLAGQLDDSTMENLSVDNDGFLRVNLAGQDRPADIDGLGSVDFTQTSVQTESGGGPTQLLSTALSGRKEIAFKNTSASRQVFVGTNPSLTSTSNSWPIDPGDTLSLPAKEALVFYGLAEEQSDTRLLYLDPANAEAFGDVQNGQNVKADDDQYADLGTVATTDRIETQGYEPTPSAGLVIFDTVDHVEIHIEARKGAAGGVNPILAVSYEFNGSTGSSTASHTITGTSKADYALDITADRTWTLADINNIKVTAARGNDGGAKRIEIDSIQIHVTESVSTDPIRVAILEMG